MEPTLATFNSHVGWIALSSVPRAFLDFFMEYSHRISVAAWWGCMREI